MPLGVRVGSAGRDSRSFQAVMSELRRLDKTSFEEFKREFRSEAKKVGSQLKSQLPSRAPISGFRPVNAPDGSYYAYRKPTMSIQIGGRARSRGRKVAAILFKDRRPTAGFSILELAGTKSVGLTQSGRNMIRGLNKTQYKLRNGGRFVIPPFYERRDKIRKTAGNILERWSAKVSRRLAKDARRSVRG